MISLTQGTSDWGVARLGTGFRVMLLPAFNAVVGFVAISVRVPVFLTTRALDGCLLGARRFYSDLGIEQVMKIVYFLVVRLGFQIHEETTFSYHNFEIAVTTTHNQL
jgi:hypothetical protein